MHSMMVILVYITMFLQDLNSNQIKEQTTKMGEQTTHSERGEKILSVKETPYWNSSVEVAEFKQLYDN